MSQQTDELMADLSELKFYSATDRKTGADTSQAFQVGCQFVARLVECGENEKAFEIFEWVKEMSAQSEAWARQHDKRSLRNDNSVRGYFAEQF